MTSGSWSILDLRTWQALVSLVLFTLLTSLYCCSVFAGYEHLAARMFFSAHSCTAHSQWREFYSISTAHFIPVNCDLQGRKINFATSKTLVGWLVGGCRERPKRQCNACLRFFSYYLCLFFCFACVSFHYNFPVFSLAQKINQKNRKNTIEQKQTKKRTI